MPLTPPPGGSEKEVLGEVDFARAAIFVMGRLPGLFIFRSHTRAFLTNKEEVNCEELKDVPTHVISSDIDELQV